ncbi:MAG: glycosyltransferase, partial [Microcystis panniformis Mp_MB_F_20051200_S6D]
YRRMRSFLFNKVRPRLGLLYQYSPRKMRSISPNSSASTSEFPKIAIVTPSFQHGAYIADTIESVLSQQYPNLFYHVQDGGSSDETLSILSRYDGRLTFVSEKDDGQSDAINRGFASTDGEVMAYLNSDDLLLPGSLQTVGSFFAQNPHVDVVYGDRIVINERGEEIGVWRLPPHSNDVLSWADYVPQETLFWRRSAWQRAGGYIDTSFRFAMDWDLLVRMRDSGARFAHIPRFLGAFRVHSTQKTSALLSTIGHDEMQRIRTRTVGYTPDHRQIKEGIRMYMYAHLFRDLRYRMFEP